MKNDLFSIGSFTVHGYGLMIALGLLSGYLIAEKRAEKKGFDSEQLLNLFFACMIGCIIGAKLLYVIVEWKTFLENPMILLDLENGFVIYGGLIGGVMGGYYYCRIMNLSFLDYFELFVPSLAFAQGIGRIGCFLAGCCYGKETDAWYGIAFQNSLIAPNHVKLIPTQLISSAFDLILAAFLLYIASKKPKQGILLAIYMLCYSLARFFIEFLRNDERGFWGVFSTSQLISIIIFVLALFFLRKIEKNKMKG